MAGRHVSDRIARLLAPERGDRRERVAARERARADVRADDRAARRAADRDEARVGAVLAQVHRDDVDVLAAAQAVRL